ncbi:retrovirus-related pol polyprotein from transposon TNT 1-94 [Tanacetum coccineum]
MCAGAIYRTEFCTEIEDSLYQKKLLEPLAEAKPTDIRRKTSREYTNYLLSAERTDTRAEGVRRLTWELETLMTRWLCCVENTVEDRIMDSGASFHATYCKEEFERFKLRFGKVRLAYDKTLDIVDVGDVVLKTSFSTSWTLKDILGLKRRIGMSMLASKGNVLDVRKVDIYFCKPGGLGKQKKLSFIMSEKTRKLHSLVLLESTGIRAEAPKMLWADSVSMTYLIYRIPHVPIGLHIPDEEWQGKDTSLTRLKVFGCDLFVKVKDVCGEAMKCKFIGRGSDEVRYSFRDTKSHQKSKVVLIDILENLVENDIIVSEHGLSSEITQSLDASSYTGEGSENNGSFEDSGRSYEEDSEDGAFSDEGGSETLQKDMNEEISSLEKNQTWSLVRLPAKKKASQRLWMFKVKDEQNSSEKLHEPSYVGALNDASTQHKSEGFQLAGQEKNLECRLKKILYGLIQAPRLRDVHQVGDEREVEVLRNFSWPPSELITEDGVLPERGYSQFNDVSSGYLVSKVS